MQTGQAESAAALAKDAAGDAIALFKAEVEVAKRELRADIEAARGGAAVLAIATGFGVVGAELVLGAIVAAGRRHPIALAFVGFACLGASVALGAQAIASMPDVLRRTRHRVAEDASRIEESLS